MVKRDYVPLSGHTTLAVGGPARYFIEARSEDEVREALDFASRKTAPLFVLGGGSNLLVSDRGFPGVVLRISIPGIARLPASSPGAGGEGAAKVLFRAGAGEEWDGFVAIAVRQGLGGIECLSGIPGSVGGTPVQNVGAYGQEVSSAIEKVVAIDRTTGDRVAFDNAACGFAYRTSRFNTADRDRFIILSVDYALVPGAAPELRYRDVAQYFADHAGPPDLARVRDAVREIRRGKGMLLVPGDPDCRSAGSFFKNPVVPEATFARIEAASGPGVPSYPGGAGHVKIPAAWLIEKAGFARGHARGGAAISSRHTLALTNRNHATAAEIIALARDIRDRVRDVFGVELKPEPVFLGFEEAF